MDIVILDLSLSELLHNCSDFGPADVWWGFFFGTASSLSSTNGTPYMSYIRPACSQLILAASRLRGSRFSSYAPTQLTGLDDDG